MGWLMRADERIAEPLSQALPTRDSRQPVANCWRLNGRVLEVLLVMPQSACGGRLKWHR